MEDRSIFLNLSPLDHRYYLANRELFEELSAYISENAVIEYCLKAESALLKSHIDNFFKGDASLKRAVDQAAARVEPDSVYREEEKTRHNIRALVNVFQKQLPDELKPYIHLGATSVDILDTAASMRLRDAVQKVVLPVLVKVEKELLRIVQENAETPQIGRTHGQHAVPITVGFAFAEYVSRLGKSIGEIHEKSGKLRGKLAGATGSYNATSLLVPDPEELERRYLSYLGLEPSEHSTQIVEPEYTLRLLLELNTAFGILANCADDLRSLQRSEIAEVAEYFSAEQVGSSTMPQKRNPWNSEHVKSLWKAFAPRVMTFYMDQISEHQRDLTNSASSRFISEYISGLCAAAARLEKVLAGLKIEKEMCMKNLSAQQGMVLAEGLYVLLAISGEEQGHEIIRSASQESRDSGVPFIDVLKRDEERWSRIAALVEKNYSLSADELFRKPELYRGKSVEKARSIAEKYTVFIRNLEKELS